MEIQVPRSFFIVGSVVCAACVSALADQRFSFNYHRELFDAPNSISLYFTSANPATGTVILNGVDSRRPTRPFTFDWGDGQRSTGFFPQQHQYTQIGNHVVTVTADYGAGQSGSAQVLARLAAPSIEPVDLPAGFEVTIATGGPLPTSRIPFYGVSSMWTAFAPSDFGVTPRPTIEYVLSTVAAVQKDMVDGNVELVDGAFRQQIWKDGLGYFYSIWYAAPVSVAAGNEGFAAGVPWSSLAHEMGHNFTLNFPRSYIYGGRIDGSANAIYSETLAQIFQHAALFEVANSPASLGLSADLAFELAQDARATMNAVRQYYEAYVQSGSPFASWNRETTEIDETLTTFMTIAYEFLANVEQSGNGYRSPVKRLTAFLARSNVDWTDSYAPRRDSPEADKFRSTLMVAAVSHGVGRDLREDFRRLGFPVDDAIFGDLNAGLPAGGPVFGQGTPVVNAASLLPSMSPGTWISVFGTKGS